MPTHEHVIVPAPSDVEATQYVHKISGILAHSRPVAFRVRGDVAEPIWWPQLDDGWAEVIRLPSGYWAACGRQALNISSLCSAIKTGSALNV